MISFECKNCGGELEEIGEGRGKCSSCRSIQPIPMKFDEKFKRANRLRLENINFDEARKIYEQILNESPNEAEAYWGAVLCRYGIEYVQDPYSGEYKPTCHRTIETPIVEDSDFLLACENAATEENRNYYLEQAKLIDAIQQKILSIVKSEKPYDIFISFKDKDDETKEETRDSKRATSLYYALKDEGYNVFFSKETLKGKAGQEYEAYIYAALKSAKVMLLLGTKQEYMQAKWVRNEWKRYRSMIEAGERKLLLPVYEIMDAYEIPYELQGYQALDMSQMDFLDSLKKTVNAFLGESMDERREKEDIARFEKMLKSRGIGNAAEKWNESGEALLRQGMYEDACDKFTKAIEQDPKYAKAYWNRLLSRLHMTEERLQGAEIDFVADQDYVLAVQGADLEERQRYEALGKECKRLHEIREKNELIDDEYNEVFERKMEDFCYVDSTEGEEYRPQNRKIIRRNKLEKQIKEQRGRINKDGISIFSIAFFVFTIIITVINEWLITKQGSGLNIHITEIEIPNLGYSVDIGILEIILGANVIFWIIYIASSLLSVILKMGIVLFVLILTVTSVLFGEEADFLRFASVIYLFPLVKFIFLNIRKIISKNKIKILQKEYSEILTDIRKDLEESCDTMYKDYCQKIIGDRYDFEKRDLGRYYMFESELKNQYLK